jgi:hypothetical protein
MTLQICVQDHTLVSTTIKGARTSNEDASYSDGHFFRLLTDTEASTLPECVVINFLSTFIA